MNPLSLRTFLSAVRLSLRGEHRDYTSGSIPQAIVLLAVPMILEMAMESLFAVVNIFWVARLGDKAVATVGVTESMFAIIFGIAMGLSVAATATVARRIGEKDSGAASHAAAQAIMLSAAVAVALGLPAAAGAGWLLRMLSGSDELAGSGSGYTRLMMLGMPSVMMLFVFNAIFRGAGNAVLAMRALWIGNGVNMALDPLLIFGLGPFPELGVTGAAIATTIGRSTGALYGLWHLLAGSGDVQLRRSSWRLDWPIIRSLVALTLPAAGQYLVPTASWVALMRIVAVFGSVAIAGYTIAMRIIVFSILPAWGLANAAATLVGQNLGAKQPERAEQSVRLCGWWNMAFLSGLGLIFIALAGPLVRLFTDDKDVVPVAVSCLKLLSYGYAFYAWGMVLIQAFNGAGDTRTPTRINLFCYWLFQLPLAVTLARGLAMGPNGVFWAVPVAESALALSAWVWFRRGQWKEVRV
jgi:putative MATE family efflux protein